MVVATNWFSDPSLTVSLIEHYDRSNQQACKEWGVASRLSNKWDLYLAPKPANGGDLEFIDDESQFDQVEGDHRIRKIQWLLDAVFVGCGYKERTDSQRLFHDAYLISALPKVYGKDWERCAARVMAQFGVKKIQQLVLGMTPRRWG